MKQVFCVLVLLLSVASAVHADWFKVQIVGNGVRDPFRPDLPPEIKDWSALIPTGADGRPLTPDAIVLVSPKIDTSKLTLKKDSVRLDRATADTEIAARDPKAKIGDIEKQP